MSLPQLVFPGLEVIKTEFILRLKIKRNDWLLVDMCILSLRLYSSFITSRPDLYVHIYVYLLRLRVRSEHETALRYFLETVHNFKLSWDNMQNTWNVTLVIGL